MMHSVLIVDDEIRFCDSLEFLLKAEGYQVNIVNSGEQAFRSLQQHAYSVALVDINLPDIDGNQIAVADHQIIHFNSGHLATLPARL